MKLNKEFFKRESTWINIIECMGATAAQLMLDLPSELSTPLWAYVSLRLFMAFVQGVKRGV